MQHFQIPSAIILEVRGRDAQRYLHNRLSNNVKALTVGDSIIAAALTPQGKTQGLFALRYDAPEKYTAICDGGDRSAVIAGLMRFKVADRVELQDRSKECTIVHVIGADEGVKSLPGVTALTRQRSNTSGADLLVEHNNENELFKYLTQKGSEELNNQTRTWLRIVGGQPEFPTEINEQTLFAESGMREAVSFTKGCYVGQEVIERIDSYGSTPRVLCRVIFDGNPNLAVGEEIRRLGDDQVFGRVVTVATNAAATQSACFASAKAGDESAIGITVSVRGVNGVVQALTGAGFGE